MYARILVILSSLWLPLIKCQGCPYSRTVVPGDPKRYIEIVHNVAHERQCAPGTEFDPLSCECSLLSAIPWSAGLAFIGGLKAAYPELANMPLDALHNELLHLTSQNTYPYDVQHNPLIVQTPNVGTNGLHKSNSLAQGDILSVLDLFQNAQPGELTPDVISAIDQVLLLESNPIKEQNSFSTHTNVFSSLPNIMSTRPSGHGNIPDHLLASLIDPIGQTHVKSPSHLFIKDGDESLFLTLTKPTPAPRIDQNAQIQEIQQLIETFQNLESPTPQPLNIPPKTTRHFRLPQVQKQSALDNFQSIAESIFKTLPTTRKPVIKPELPSRQFTPPQIGITKRPTFSVPIPHVPQPHRFHQNNRANSIPKPIHRPVMQNVEMQNKKLFPWPIPKTTPPKTFIQPRKQIPPPPPKPSQAPPQRTTQFQDHQTHHQVPKSRFPSQVIPAHLQTASLDLFRNDRRNQISEIPAKGNALPFDQSISNNLKSGTGKRTDSKLKAQFTVQIPSTWQYFSSLSNKTPDLKDPLTPKMSLQLSSFKLPNHWQKFTLDKQGQSTHDAKIQHESVTKSDSQGKAIKEESIAVHAELPETKMSPTTTPTLQETTTSSQTTNSSDPKDELSATKLLKLIKKKLKQAKKTGNIPFSLLKMLLVKRKMLIQKLKEERENKETQSNNKEKTKGSLKTTDKPKITPTLPKVKTTEHTTSKTPTKSTNNTVPSQDPKTTSSPGSFVNSVAPKSNSSTVKVDNMSSESLNTKNKTNSTINANKIHSFSSGGPQAPLFDISTTSSKRKSRKSKPPEFHYIPQPQGFDAHTHELINLLARKPLVNLYSSNQFNNAHPPSQSLPDTSGSSQANVPQLDLFSHSPISNIHNEAPKLKSPLLSQDLATLTAYLREKNEQRLLQALQKPKPEVRKFFIPPPKPTQRAYREPVITEAPPTPTMNIQSFNNDNSNKHNTGKSQQSSSIMNQPPPSGLDAQKRAILQKLMKKLSDLQAQSENNGQSTSNIPSGTGTSNVETIGTRTLNMQLSKRKSSAGNQPSAAGHHKSPGSQQSAYSMMFNGIAAKEGASDAQEIMQDKITEMGGGLAMMDSPMFNMNMMNSEISSQLGSTVFENHPMAFLL